eukprot:TRINITY_DN520_c0_g2_i3.p1 TRINITY_DN520_c0_g2~~TRINITY_DN520_c0_g2_i3.p1  ORF type:complete len:544 (+),score=80.94 TRINITY_DN520_c0_g2_i3:73-1632(+)
MMTTSSFNPTLLALGNVWDDEEVVVRHGSPTTTNTDVLNQSWSGQTTASSNGSHDREATPHNTRDRTRCSKVSHLCQALEAAHVKGDAIECNKLSTSLSDMGVTAYISQCKWVDSTGLSGTWRQPGAPKKRPRPQALPMPVTPLTPTSPAGLGASIGAGSTSAPPVQAGHAMCSLLPSFITQLYDSSVQNILFLGCGGGHDFVTSMLLYRDLTLAGKTVTVLSNSFSDVGLHADTPVVFDDNNGCTVKRVGKDTKMNVGKLHEGFCPEIHLAGFLSDNLPGREHCIYAANVKRWRMQTLKNFLKNICKKHETHAIVVWDYGTDSLMKGDEYVVGDAVEDAVTVGAVAGVTSVGLKMLLCSGFGVDQQSGVSNTDSLRSIAEVTELGGFRGSVSIEPTSAAASFYRAASEHINSFPTYSSRSMTHRTNVVGALSSSISGKFGHFCPSHEPPSDQRQAYCFLTPQIATIYALDVNCVASRSMIIPWIKNCRTIAEQHQKLAYQRSCLRNSNTLRAREAATM